MRTFLLVAALAILAGFSLALDVASSPAFSPGLAPAVAEEVVEEGCDCLTDVIASAVFELDATKSDSYSGSGTTWANRVLVPADGSAQTAYDFYRGDGATSTTYPTFNGSAGSAAAYWSFDGGDYFGLKSGSNTAFFNALHKTTGGSDFWIAVTIQTPVADSTVDALFSTQITGATVAGLRLVQTAAEAINLIQRGTANTTAAATGTLTGSTDYIVIASHSHSGNNTRFWISATTAQDVAQTFNTTTANPETARIGYAATAAASSGLRIYGISGGNEYIDNTKAAEIISYLETQHGRDYTP